LSAAFETLVKLLRDQHEHQDRDRKRGKAFEEATRSGRSAYERLNQIAERMRHLTNLDRAEERVIDLNELCRDTVAFFQAELNACARVSLNLSPLPPLKCRPQQISAVLSNLLRNAAAASKEEGTISVVTDRRSSEVVVEVRDDGRGIAAERLPTLFEPEFHVEGGRVTTTNWGLFVSRSIVAEHSGSIQIESELGQGTTARVLLPIPSRS
jgi:signal transduction histidine kinase